MPIKNICGLLMTASEYIQGARIQRKTRYLIKVNITNLVIFLTAMIIYILNQGIFKKMSASIFSGFSNDYLNDCLAPFVLLSFSSIFISFWGAKLQNALHIALIIIPSIIIWEFVTPLYKKTSVTDMRDVICYVTSASIYWLIIKIWERKRNYE